MEEEEEEQIPDPALGIAARPKICCRLRFDTRRSAQARILLWNDNKNILMAELCVGARFQYLLSYIVVIQVAQLAILKIDTNYDAHHQLPACAHTTPSAPMSRLTIVTLPVYCLGCVFTRSTFEKLQNNVFKNQFWR